MTYDLWAHLTFLYEWIKNIHNKRIKICTLCAQHSYNNTLADQPNWAMAGSSTSPAIGIDLGTTYSCVAVWRNDRRQVHIIPNEQGNRTTPSYVSFNETVRFVGEEAKINAARNPINTVFGASRSSNILFFLVCY